MTSFENIITPIIFNGGKNIYALGLCLNGGRIHKIKLWNKIYDNSSVYHDYLYSFGGEKCLKYYSTTKEWKKTYPGFSDIITDKGYCPGDLLTFRGKLNITKSYLRKKIENKESRIDPYGLLDSYQKNLSFFKSVKIDRTLFCEKGFTKALDSGKFRDDFSIALSQAFYSNRFSS